MSGIKCFELLGLGKIELDKLTGEFNSLIAKGVSDKEAGLSIVNKLHKDLHAELEQFKRKISPDPSKYKKEAFKPFDNSQKIKEINDNYDKLISNKKSELEKQAPVVEEPTTKPISELSDKEIEARMDELGDAKLGTPEAKEYEELDAEMQRREEIKNPPLKDHYTDKVNNPNEITPDSINRVKEDLKNGFYEKEIKEGRLTADGLRDIVKSFGLRITSANATILRAENPKLVKELDKNDQSKKPPVERTIPEHAQYIKDTFREVFKKKGNSDEHIDAAIALMDARARSLASEVKGRTPEEWYQRIADVRNGEFETNSTEILFQVLDDIDVFKSNNEEKAKAFITKVFNSITSKEDAKIAYRKLAMKYHPDKNTSETAKSIFQHLQNENSKFSTNKTKETSFSMGDMDFMGTRFDNDPIWDELNKAFEAARNKGKNKPKFQDQTGTKKGALETLADGRVVIHALTSPDISTMVHEVFHIFEKDLTSAELKQVEDFGGSEAFARAGERYLRSGKAPTPELESLFQKFKRWLTNIYRTIKGSPLEKKITPEIKNIFDRMLTEVKPEEPIGVKKEEAKAPKKEIPLSEKYGVPEGIDADYLRTVGEAIKDGTFGKLIESGEVSPSKAREILKYFNVKESLFGKELKEADRVGAEFMRDQLKEILNGSSNEEVPLNNAETDFINKLKANKDSLKGEDASTIKDALDSENYREVLNLMEDKISDDMEGAKTLFNNDEVYKSFEKLIESDGSDVLAPVSKAGDLTPEGTFAPEDVVKEIEPKVDAPVEKYVTFKIRGLGDSIHKGYGRVIEEDGAISVVRDSHGGTRDILSSVLVPSTKEEYESVLVHSPKAKFNVGDKVVYGEDKKVYTIVDSEEHKTNERAHTGVVKDENGKILLDKNGNPVKVTENSIIGDEQIFYTTEEGVKISEEGIVGLARDTEVNKEFKIRVEDEQRVRVFKRVVTKMESVFPQIKTNFVYDPTYDAPARFNKGFVEINLSFKGREGVDPNDPVNIVHEYMHPLVSALKSSNAELYRALLKEAGKDGDIMSHVNELVKSGAYIEENKMDEALVIKLSDSIKKAFNKDGTLNVEYVAEREQSLVRRFLEWIRDIFKYFTGSKKIVSLEDFVKKANAGTPESKNQLKKAINDIPALAEIHKGKNGSDMTKTIAFLKKTFKGAFNEDGTIREEHISDVIEKAKQTFGRQEIKSEQLKSRVVEKPEGEHTVYATKTRAEDIFFQKREISDSSKTDEPVELTAKKFEHPDMENPVYVVSVDGKDRYIQRVSNGDNIQLWEEVSKDNKFGVWENVSKDDHNIGFTKEEALANLAKGVTTGGEPHEAFVRVEKNADGSWERIDNETLGSTTTEVLDNLREGETRYKNATEGELQNVIDALSEYLQEKPTGRFQFIVEESEGGGVRFDQSDLDHIKVYIDPEFAGGVSAPSALLMYARPDVSTGRAGIVDEAALNEFTDIVQKTFYKQGDNKDQDRSIGAKDINPLMKIQDISDLITKEIGSDNPIQVKYSGSELTAIDELVAYRELSVDESKAVSEKIAKKMGILLATANERLDNDTLRMNYNILNRLRLDNKDRDFVVKYIAQAAISANLGWRKFNEIKTDLKDIRGINSPTVAKAKLSRLNKELDVVKQLVSFYDDFTDLYTGHKEEFSDQELAKFYKATTNLQLLRDKIKTTAIDLTTEWFMPFMEIHNKTLAKNGYTDPKYMITEDKMKSMLRFGTTSDTNFITFNLGTTVTSRDPVTAIFSNIVSDMFANNNIDIVNSVFDIDAQYGKFIKEHGMSNLSSAAQVKYYKDHYLREADVLVSKYNEQKLDYEDVYVKKLAFHQEFYADKYWKDLQAERAKYENPRNSMEATKFAEQLDAWEASKKHGKSEEYRNLEYAKLQSDPYFKLLEKHYNESNEKYGRNSLSFGIIPQKYGAGAIQKMREFIKENEENPTFKDKALYVKDSLVEALGGRVKNGNQQSIDGTTYRRIKSNLNTIKEDKDIDFNLNTVMADFIAESTNYASLKEVQYNAETLRMLIEGNTKFGIDARKVGVDDVRDKIRSDKDLRVAKNALAELQTLKDNGEAYDTEAYDRLQKRVERGVQPKTLWDKLANTNKPANTAMINEQLTQFMNDAFYGESIQDFHLGKVDMHKAARLVSMYTSINNMAFNTIAGVSNVVIGNVQMLIEGQGGQFYNKADLAKAQASYISNIPSYIGDLKNPIKTKDTQLSFILDAIQGEVLDEFGNRISGNIARKIFSTNSLFFFTTAGEHQIQLTGMKAMLLGRKVTTNDGKVISLYDAYTPNADGRYNLRSDLKDFNKDDLDQFIRQLHSVNRSLNGNYSSLHKSTLQRKWYGTLALKFRKYIYDSFRTRYASEHTDFERNTIEEGYMRFFFKDYLYANLKKMALHQDTDFAGKELLPHQKFAMKKATMEVGIYGFISVMLAAMFSGKDKKNLSTADKTMLLYALRLRNDLGMYSASMYSEFKQQATNPTASITTIQALVKTLGQTFSPSETYKTTQSGHKKGDSKLQTDIRKLIPIVSKFPINIDNKLSYFNLINQSVEGVTKNANAQ